MDRYSEVMFSGGQSHVPGITRITRLANFQIANANESSVASVTVHCISHRRTFVKCCFLVIMQTILVCVVVFPCWCFGGHLCSEFPMPEGQAVISGPIHMQGYLASKH